MNFSKAIKVQPVLDYASGTATRNSDAVDTRGFRGVTFVVHYAAIAAGAATTVKLQGATTSNFATPIDLIGTSITVADDDDNEVRVLELYAPIHRYIRVVVVKDASNAVAESAVAYLYDADEEPVAHAVDAIAEFHHAIGAGTP